MKPKVLFAGSSKSRLVPAFALALASITTGHAQELIVSGGTVEPAAAEDPYIYNATSGNSGIRNGGTFKVNTGVNVTVNNSNNNVWFGIGDVNPSSSLLWLNGGSMTINSQYGTILGREAEGTITIDSGSLTVNKCNFYDHAIKMGDTVNGKGTLNLNGGTLTTYSIAVGPNVNNVINFNGGTLKPTANKTDWIANSTNILTQVRNGGAKIDTDVFNVTIGEQLVHVSGDAAIDGGLTKSGDGILTLSGANTYTGATTISSGTLSISADNNLGAAPTTATPGSLVINGGTLAASAGFALSNNRGIALGSSTAGTGGAIDVAASQTLTYGGIVANNGGTNSLTKTGSGTLTLSGINSFTGAVVVNKGTLSATTVNSPASGAFSTVSDITVNNGGTLKSGENALFGYGGTVEKNITVNTGGEITADIGVNINVGTVTLNGGTMSNGGASAAWGSWTFRHAGDKLLVTENSTVSAQNVHMRSGAYIDVATGKTLSFTGTLTNVNSELGSPGALIKQGAGTITLSGNNTYAGATSVSAGTLEFSGTNTGQGNLIIDGTTALTKITGGSMVINSTLGGTYIVGGGTLEIDGGALTLQGDGSWFSVGRSYGSAGGGAGTLTLKTGSFTTTNQHGLTVTDKTGTINISGGTFTANGTANNGIILGEGSGGNGTLNLSGGTLITDQIRGGAGTGAVNFGGGKLQATGDVADILANNNNITTTILAGGLKIGGTTNFTISEGMGGTGGITKEDANTVTISGSNTFNGATTVTAGTLKVSGSIASSDVTVNGGILASGATGTVGKDVTVNTGAKFAAGDVGTVGAATVANDLNFSSGSIFDWDLTTDTNTYDTVSVTGALNITSGAKFNVVSSTAFTDAFWDTTRTWSNIFGSKTIDNFLVSNFLYSGSATAPAAEGAFTVSGNTLTWTAVPEPTSALAGLLLTAGLLRRRRCSPSKGNNRPNRPTSH